MFEQQVEQGGSPRDGSVSVSTADGSLSEKKVWDRVQGALLPQGNAKPSLGQRNVAALQTACSMAKGRMPSAEEQTRMQGFAGWSGGMNDVLFADTLTDDEKTALNRLAEGKFYDAYHPGRIGGTLQITPALLADEIWRAVELLGFPGGRILYPGAGHGALLSYMPSEMAKSSFITAIEPDRSAHSILKALYEPFGVRTINSTFQDASLPDAFYDLAICNVPKIVSNAQDTRNVLYQNHSLPTYFISRSIELLREGGLLAVIAPMSVMNVADDAARSFFASAARLLHAIRLPKEAFPYLGTDTILGADLLFFQKTTDVNVGFNPEEWVPSQCHDKNHFKLDASVAFGWHRGKQMFINKWFEKHPQSVLGDYCVGFNYRLSLRIEARDDKWKNAVRQQVDCLPNDLYASSSPSTDSRPGTWAGALQPMCHVLDADGGVGMLNVDGSKSRLVGVSEPKLERLRGLIEIRDRCLRLFHANESASDPFMAGAEGEALFALYQTFVQRFGYLNAPENIRVFAKDPYAHLLRALEQKQEDGSYGPSSILENKGTHQEAVVEAVESPLEAMKLSLARKGRIDPSWMAKLVGMDADQMMTELDAEGVACFDPDTSRWQEAGAFLSGNVREKIRRIEALGSGWERYVERLQSVLPRDLAPHEIHVRLGASWIPSQIYSHFVGEMFVKGKSPVAVVHEKLSGTWSVRKVSPSDVTRHARASYGVDNVASSQGVVTPVELAEKCMNGVLATITMAAKPGSNKRCVDHVKTMEAREKQEVIENLFRKWAWADKERSAMLCSAYNESLRSVVGRSYNGSHLELPGLSKDVSLYQSQKNGIWRIISSPVNTLLGHKVGFGKTLQLICAGMELRRLGKATKIAYTVPGDTLPGFVSTFVHAYPSAKLLVADKETFAKEGRCAFWAAAAMGDWDGIVLSHDAFESIQPSYEALLGSLRSDMAVVQSVQRSLTQAGSAIKRQLTSRSKALEKEIEWAKTACAASSDKDNLFSFEKIGFDWLMVDEAHCFKNLGVTSKMSDLMGVSTASSKRAKDMLIKTRIIMRRRKSADGIVFATGTPIANSLVEMYTMQHYLQAETLYRAGIESFDAWAANFGEAVTAIEVAPDGSGYRTNRRFAKFSNVPDLMAMFLDSADIKMEPPEEISLPGVHRKTITAKKSPELTEYMKVLVQRSAAVRNRAVDAKADNMLMVTNDGRKAALDMRMVDSSVGEVPGTKVRLCIEQVFEIWKSSAEDRLTQLVFCDLGTPNAKTCPSVYKMVKEGLISLGVPPREIAFIQDAKTSQACNALEKKLNMGEIRIAIGSTSKLGTGRNVQDRVCAIHHLDAPWRPADIEQREGRGERHGNRNVTLSIYRYVTEGSFDAYIWQGLEIKARFTAQVMQGATDLRSVEDLEMVVLTYSEVKALATGNPLVLEKTAIDGQVVRLSVLRQAHARSAAEAKRAAGILPDRIVKTRADLADVQDDLKTMGDAVRKPLVVNGRSFTTHKDWAKVIDQVATMGLGKGLASIKVGTIGAFVLEVARMFGRRGYAVRLTGKGTYQESWSGGWLAASNAVRRLVSLQGLEGESRLLEIRLESMERDLIESNDLLKSVFPQENAYQKALKRQAEIGAALKIL